MNNSGRELALLVMRLGLGINMAMHGLVRLPKLNAFADKVAADFATTLLPALVARSFAFTLPVLELGVGLVILLGGRFLTHGLLGGGLIISLLMFGTSLREDWATLGSQVVYLMAFALALFLTDPRRN